VLFSLVYPTWSHLSPQYSPGGSVAMLHPMARGLQPHDRRPPGPSPGRPAIPRRFGWILPARQARAGWATRGDQ
jgi:hypothetical protein